MKRRSRLRVVTSFTVTALVVAFALVWLGLIALMTTLAFSPDLKNEVLTWDSPDRVRSAWLRDGVFSIAETKEGFPIQRSVLSLLCLDAFSGRSDPTDFRRIALADWLGVASYPPNPTKPRYVVLSARWWWSSCSAASGNSSPHAACTGRSRVTAAPAAVCASNAGMI
jgi:hypothetical protein